jgi:AraC family transcriptional regulator of adaptative response / DNA-3-methyladenine glycosylase II
VPGAWDPFELAVRAILGQQISVKGATTLAGRIAGSFGEKLIGEVSDGSREPAPDMIFPTPAVLAEADLSRIGLTRARAHTIRELARAVETGELVMDTAIELPELEEMLTRLPGIGNWTAQYIAMRALGEPDAFPATDLALLRAAGNGKAITPRALLEQAESWRPWRAYAAMYLWQSYTKQTRQTRSRPGRNHQR